ncbi:MAG: hypothetical protein MK105_15985 [Crocinitomicaceae bacterium]|nr:hypothetical protein [Crocinitomicaceae bacterium]
MKKAIIIIPIVLFSILTILSVMGRIRFGHGLGDMIYHPLIYLGILLSLINFAIFRNKQSNVVYLSTAILTSFFVLIFLKMTLWRGPEYSWNGDIIAPSSATIEKRKNKDFNNKLEEYNERISAEPDNYELLVEKGFFLRSNGKYTEAIEIFKKAQSLDNEKYKAYWEAGYAFSLLEDYESAVREYEKGYEIDTSNIRLKSTIESLKSQHNIE